MPDAVLGELLAATRYNWEGSNQLPSPADRKRIRVRSLVSPAEMAAVVGVGHSTLIRWENGGARPTGDAAIRYGRILAALQIPVLV